MPERPLLSDIDRLYYGLQLGVKRIAWVRPKGERHFPSAAVGHSQTKTDQASKLRHPPNGS